MFKHKSLLEPIFDNQRRGDEYDAICDGRESRLLSMLDGIVAASEEALAELQADKGGSRQQSILGGSANEELVASCQRLFEQHRPGEASTTEGGDFRDFMTLVYEVSTGEMGVDLERPVKEHMRRLRQNRKSN